MEVPSCALACVCADISASLRLGTAREAGFTKLIAYSMSLIPNSAAPLPDPFGDLDLALPRTRSTSSAVLGRRGLRYEVF
jgi:hypothetical protein